MKTNPPPLQAPLTILQLQFYKYVKLYVKLYSVQNRFFSMYMQTLISSVDLPRKKKVQDICNIIYFVLQGEFLSQNWS